jgi:DNA polymerase III sliding clamp (beta) subunit (PCNA family)
MFYNTYFWIKFIMLKISFKTEELKKIVSSVQSICQKKTVSDNTSHLFVNISDDVAVFKATDLEVFAEFTIPVFFSDNFSFDFPFPINFLVNAKRFYDIIKDIDFENIDLLFDGNKLGILIENSEIFLNTYQNDSFLDRNALIENLFSVKSKDLLSLISFCLPLSSTNLHNPNINSIFFEFGLSSFSSTSTDGHCLSHISYSYPCYGISSIFSFLISKKSSSDLKKILESNELSDSKKDIIIGKFENEIVFSSSFFTIFVKTVSQKFPDYYKIIETSSFNKISFNRESLQKSFKRLSYITDNKFIPSSLLFNFSSHSLSCSLTHKDVGSIKEVIFFNSETNFSNSNLQNFIISVFSPYVLQAIISLNLFENITLMSLDKCKPLLLEGSNELNRMIYVIMPMISS